MRWSPQQSAEVEQYAARRTKLRNSPGQFGLDGRQLRSSKTQKKLRWITIHPNGKDEEGRPVQIDDEGRITAGAVPAAMHGKKLSELGARKKGTAQGEKPEGQASKQAPAPADGVSRISNEEFASGDWDRAHSGLASEIVQSKIAIGMRGIEGREYAIREHAPGKWQLISRPGRKADESRPEKGPDDDDGFQLANEKPRPEPEKFDAKAPAKEQALFHGLKDKPGQEKLFGGMDLAYDNGRDDEPEISPKAQARREPQTKPEGDRPAPGPDGLHWYGLKHRPAGHSHMPKGSVKTTEHPAFKNFGIVGYEKPLSDKDVADFELAKVYDEHNLGELVGKIRAGMGDYASEYAKPEHSELLDEKIGEALGKHWASHLDPETVKQAFLNSQRGEGEQPAEGQPGDAPKADWDGLPLVGRSGFEQNVLRKLRDQVAQLDKLATNPMLGPRYAWEAATNHGVKPGDPHAGSESLDIWKQNAAKAGFDGDALVKGHAEYNDLVKRLDDYRAWGDQSTRPNPTRQQPAEPIQSSPVGRGWDSVQGKRQVEHVANGRAYVKTDGSPTHEIVPLEELDKLVNFEGKQHAGRKEQKAKSEETAAANRQKEALRNDIDGFASDASPMQRARAIKTLNQTMRVNGKIATRKEHIRELIGKGYAVDEKGNLTSPEGTFLEGSRLSKTGVDYARHLQGQRQEPPAEANGPSFADTYQKHSEAGHDEFNAKIRALAEHLQSRGVEVDAKRLNERHSVELMHLPPNATPEQVAKTFEHHGSEHAKRDPSGAWWLRQSPSTYGKSPDQIAAEGKQREKDRTAAEDHAQMAEQYARIIRAVGGDEAVAGRLDAAANRLRGEVAKNRKAFAAAGKTAKQAEERAQQERRDSLKFNPGPHEKPQHMTPARIASEMAGLRYNGHATLREHGWLTDGKFLMRPTEKLAEQLTKRLPEKSGNDRPIPKESIDHILGSSRNSSQKAEIVGNRPMREAYRGKPQHAYLLADPTGQHSMAAAHYVDTIRKHHPNATWSIADNEYVFAEDGGEVVGVVAPIHDDDQDSLAAREAHIKEHAKSRSRYSAAWADVEQYAKDSPGQLALFGTGTSSPYYRRREVQQRLGFDRSDDSNLRWITIHPNGPNSKGRAIQINAKTGEIVKGPKALAGKKLSDLRAKRKATGETKPKETAKATNTQPKPALKSDKPRTGKVKLGGKEYHAKFDGGQWFFSRDPAAVGWTAAGKEMAKRMAAAMGHEPPQDRAAKPATEPEKKKEPARLKSEPKAGGDYQREGDRAETVSRIEDFGAKIGGARKDTAGKLGPRGKAGEKDQRPGWRKRYHIGQDAKSGKWFIADRKAKSRFGGRLVSSPTGQRDFASKEEAEQAIPLIEVARNHGVSYRRSGENEQWHIYRRVSDRKRPVVKDGFKSREDALRYMATHPEKIIEHKTRIDDSIHPELEKVERVGKDHRDGKPIKPQAFHDEFGFRGVEFGNWNNRAERQHVLNHAYDSFHDLAEVLGLPPKAVSLDGQLGLGFGSRGHGLQGARAHYEPDYGAINLTKLKGAGSLAHEWMHALDHHLGRLSGKARSERTTNSRGDKVYEAESARDAFVSHGHPRKLADGYSEELRDAFDNAVDAVLNQDRQFVEDADKAKRINKRTEEDLHSALDDFRKHLAHDFTKSEYQPYRGKKRNLPLPADKLKEADALIAKIKAGDYGKEIMLPTKTRYGLGPTMHENVAKLNAIYKEHRGRNAYAGTAGRYDGRAINVHRAIKAHDRTGSMLAEAESGKVKTSKVRSNFFDEARRMDEGGAKDYWTTRHEMMARAFESYVYDKIKAKKGRNDFLAYEKHNELPEYKLFGIKPYPEGEERKRINAAFDKLVGAYRKHVAGGRTRDRYAAGRGAAVDRMVAGAIGEQYRALTERSKQAKKDKPKTVIGKFGDRGRYVTIHDHPVFITEDGRINRGPREIRGRHEHEFRHATGEITREHRRRPDQPTFTPRTKVEHAIVEAVGDHADDVETMKHYVGHAHQMLKQEAHDTNAELRDLLAHFGYTGKAIPGFLAAMRRYRDPSKIDRFDQMVDMAERHYPHLLGSGHGESVGEGDTEHALFERLRGGFAQVPAKHAPEVMELAQEMAGGSLGHDPESYDLNDDGRIGALVYESDDPFAAPVPFAALWYEQAVERLHAASV